MTVDNRIGDAEFESLRELILRNFGIALSDEKRGLLEARLARVMRDQGFDDFSAYCNSLIVSGNVDSLSEFFNCISTNHTHFYREPAHFDYLASDALVERVGVHREDGTRDLRVWCAASSSGEEPYMLAMLVREALGVDAANWRAGVLATDLSSDVLDTARMGLYEKENVERLPVRFRNRYFVKHPSGKMQVSAELRSEVVFRRLNLIKKKFPFTGTFDVIFCRNVMIYFDAETQRRLVNKLYDSMQDGGYLFVGHSEALDRTASPFEFVRPGVHRRVSGSRQGSSG